MYEFIAISAPQGLEGVMYQQQSVALLGSAVREAAGAVIRCEAFLLMIDAPNISVRVIVVLLEDGQHAAHVSGRPKHSTR